MCFYQLENKTARILHVGLGGGKSLAIPPMETGGIVVEMTDPEKAAFAAAMATEEVKGWIDGGMLIITEKEEEPPPPEAGEGEGETGTRRDPEAPPPTDPSLPEAPPSPSLPQHEPPPEVPEHVRRGRRSRDE